MGGRVEIPSSSGSRLSGERLVGGDETEVELFLRPTGDDVFDIHGKDESMMIIVDLRNLTDSTEFVDAHRRAGFDLHDIAHPDPIANRIGVQHISVVVFVLLLLMEFETIADSIRHENKREREVVVVFHHRKPHPAVFVVMAGFCRGLDAPPAKIDSKPSRRLLRESVSHQYLWRGMSTASETDPLGV
mmetsp:Transcript_12582/g.29166  ORF Transcript_12582/g.29166 Transcript_12582/m.29166 type:complete len:188 (+) Transcript_12582:821-1384(+)